MSLPLIAILGNPNVGKTALFNRLTGQNARVGNYPGMEGGLGRSDLQIHAVQTRPCRSAGLP